MTEEDLTSSLVDSMNDSITSPGGRSLSLVCTKDTTIFSDTAAKKIPIPEKYVIVEVTPERTGYTLQKIYGHPNVDGKWKKVTAPQPAVVVPTYRANLILYDSLKGFLESPRYDMNVTRDAWYYLGSDAKGVHCRNIAFEPHFASKNRYLTEEIHFPSPANKNIRGFFLLEAESQRGKEPRQLHAEPVSNHNPYGNSIPFRGDSNIAEDVMFHIGGFYEAAGIPWAHAKWLGGSEGCFAFIPKKNTMKTESEASRITLETAFFSNRTWVNWTQIIERHRDLDPQKRFFVQIIKRHQVERDAVKTVFYMSPALSTSVSKPDVDGVMYYPDDGLFGNF